MTAAVAWHTVLLATATIVLVVTVYLFATDARKRMHPGPVLICIVIVSCAAMLARSAMELALLKHTSDFVTIVDVANHEGYGALGAFWCEVYFQSATTFWFLMLAMDLISSLSNPFLPFQSNNLIHHAHAWPAAAVWTVVVRVSFFERHLHGSTVRVLLHLPSYVVILYILVALHVAWSKSRVLQYEAHISTRNMAMLILPYLGVFGAATLVGLGIYLGELSTGVTTTTNAIDQLTGAVATIAVFVLYYFGAPCTSPDRGKHGLRRRRARFSTMTDNSVGTPDEPDYLPPDDDYAVDVALKMRKSIMECTAAGIHEAAAGMNLRGTVPGQIPADTEFTKVESKGILVHGQLATASDRLRFQDVAPLVFQSIRELFGIDAAAYRDAFAPSELLRECGLKGKSGNIMYFTHNMQFLVKSVPKEEFDVLRTILPHYYKYLVAHRATHLCRYFGCHSITLPVGTRCMYFVVMQNLFNEGRVHEIYDLKGNTDRRQAIADADVEAVMQQTLRRQTIDTLMLDIDFSRVHRCMNLSEANAAAMKGQLKLDITFLAEQNIMDYSILVGVQHVRGDDNGAASGLCNHVPSKDLTDLYFVGIIDMLQQYNWRWAVVQRWALGALLCKDTQDVSAVPARKYAARLLHFIRFSMFNASRRTSRASSLHSPFTIANERPSGLGQARILIDPEIMLDASSSMMWLSDALQGASSDARQHPGPVLTCILLSSSLAVVFSAAMHLVLDVGGAADYSVVDMANYSTLPSSDVVKNALVLFWAMFFFVGATTFWYLMLALDLIASLLNPFLPFQANALLHHICAWPSSALWLVVFRAIFASDGAATPYMGLALDIPLYAALVYIALALLLAWRKSRLFEARAHRTTRRMAKRILPYLLIFGVAGAVSLAVSIADVAHGGSSEATNVIGQIAQVAELVAVFGFFAADARGRRTPSDATNGRQTDEDNTAATDATGDYDVSNVLRQCIMKYTSMGIIESATRVTPRADIDLSDYGRVETKTIVVHGSLDSTSLTFEDCAPVVFQHIRSLLGIGSRDYIASFAPNDILNEHGSEGKSGNLFYFTANRQFMVKSVPKAEFDTLRSILPFYHSYLQAHPNSFLYLGCHSISLPVGSRRMYFVVMHNLFHEGPVHQRFDLKGNTDRRQAIRSDDVERYIHQARARQAIKKLMMDVDFLKLRQAIHVDEDLQAEMQSQLVEDIRFLSARGIMDYSILVGVVFCATAPPHATVSKARDRRYHVGIVDMLQRYTWRWTLQRYFLKFFMCKDASNVSAVTPANYGARLEQFVRERLFWAPAPCRSIASSDTAPIHLSYDLDEPLASPYIAVFSKNRSPRGASHADRIPAFFVGT
ncbi:phosphatidylinositol 4-phosphate 5-kinase (PIPK-D11/GPCR-PIPK) [Achlya hypogyna]|uniref:Phosphatidylinositol 4-phosphate 5-kinase (PIPK-D11/GPCR-PIPK) n=1 Tax=Achlya hypogyna TaxID=1202772 RepID=A0A1V9ZJP6_ACHHY|nr:phosphatidylinositol 4-phosphate 5-kinase (PIPK-D11/GPCR-PIPK) [Achlya hypogyna]